MFFIRHPRPVVDGRAVAVQVVQQRTAQEVSRTLLIVETPPPSVSAPAAPGATAAAPETGSSKILSRKLTKK